MKQYSLLALISISMIAIVMAFVKKENAYPDKHLEIVLRNIGHQVLLHSNDSTSRVLPIKTINENTFQISFENSFGFTPDTLMNLVHQQLANTKGLSAYTVSVLECNKNETIFAYEVNKASGDLKPCRGRVQKKDCYIIEISFPGKNTFPFGWLFIATIPIIATGLYIARRRNKISNPQQLPKEKVDSEPVPNIADHKKLGNFVFSPSNGLLSLNGEGIELSEKEAKALSILTSNQNEVVGRDLLMKALWEDDGVFVITRNVDVLISKLRKRLSADPSVRIVNVHGKGYKLMA